MNEHIARTRCLRRVAFATLLLFSFGALAEHYTVPLLVPAGTSSEPQGVLRILNATDESGAVEIYAIDDAGTRSGPATFTLNASAAVQFTATDLASGNATLGLTGGIGSTVGDARLQIETDLQIVPLAFVQAADGTLSAMHDTVRGGPADKSGGYTYSVPVFNPSTEMTQVSRLRLINPGDAAAAVTIGGRDDSGAEAIMGDVTLTLPAGGAKTLTAQQLEAGDTDLTGQLGAGTGKWRLTVSSDQPLEVVNIVASTAGYRNNLSTTAVAGTAPGNQAGFNERFVGSSIIYETSSARSTLEAADGNLFTDTVEADGVTETYMGSYSYRAIGPDAGLLTLDYDDGDACRANLYFSSRTSGWFASHCTGSDYPAEGSWLAGTWLVEADDGAGGVTETAYEVNDALPGVPTSGLFAPSIIGDGSLQFTSSGTTIGLNNGTYFELNDGTRYTCASANGCTITNGTVTAGTVTGRAPGAGEVDRFPSFRTAAAPGNQTYTVGTAIGPLALPEASGGNGTLSYSLTPSVPGLSFNATTRQLTGTPSTAGTYTMTYTVTDEDGDTDTLGFTITVSAGTTQAGSLGECFVSLMVGTGQSCTYPGTTDAFSVNVRGRGSFLGRLAGIRIGIENQMIDGRVYDFEASHQGDGVWRIDRIAGSTGVPATEGGIGGMDDGVSVADYEQVVPLLLSASNQIQQGFVRVVNRSPGAGSVAVLAIDDSGRAFGPVQLRIGGGAAVDLNSRDLEQGNPSKGLSGGVGAGQGDWRLALRTELDIQATPYVHTADGFVAPLHALARKTVSTGNHSGYHVPTFNPGSEESALSSLRLINMSNQRREVTISGIDEQGAHAPGGTVRTVLEAHESRSVTARQLEDGAPGLDGSLGDGRGTWRLFLAAEPDVLAMSLVENPIGHLANISRGGTTDSLDVDEPRVYPRHSIPLFLSASSGVREGLLRIVNHAERTGSVSVRALDDSGRSFGPVEFTLLGNASVEFTSEDLENGNPGKGLSRGVGDGTGDWRLELVSDLPIEAMAYVRTTDGLLTNVQDVTFNDGDVPTFNPGSNARQRSSLRLVNTLDRAVQVTLEGIDERGEPSPGGVVRLTLPAGVARTLAAQQLEHGGEGLRGRLGDGTGKWRLSVSAPQGVVAMSLLESPTGHLSNVSGGAYAEESRHSDADGDCVADKDDAFPHDPARQSPENGVSTTVHGQIVMELGTEETASPSLFDLNGRTLFFQYDGASGYVRSIEPLSWEAHFGSAVGNEAVSFQSFEFPFAGSSWDAFYVNVNGNITFGKSLGRPPADHRWAQLRHLGDAFTKELSTIAAMYKPKWRGRRYVNRLADRVVVTWALSGPQGLEAFSHSADINEFQAVLFADGSIAFNYRDMSTEDGIVGLFPMTEPTEGNRLVVLNDPIDAGLPAHLDLTKVTVSDAHPNSLIVEFETRGTIPQSGDPRVNGLNYSFYLDVDAPPVDRIDFSDVDYAWRISAGADNRYSVYAFIGEAASAHVLPTSSESGGIRVAISIPGFEGGSVAAFADTWETVEGATALFDQALPVVFQLPAIAADAVDLSTYGPQGPIGYEAFHLRGVPDRQDLICRLIGTLGDGFDFVVFSSEFRVDQQIAVTPMVRFGEMPTGLGLSDHPNQDCSEGALQGSIYNPIYMNSEIGRGKGPQKSTGDFNYALSLIGHEMGHVWLASASHETDGEREQLNDDHCSCHWRWDLHAPVAFPWEESRQASTMGGGYWEENPDGTFTLVADHYLVPASGFSHLDLYLMGILDAAEVPDTFLLRDPVLLNRDEAFGVYSGTKQSISIDQVIAALGPRIPAAANSQKEFNVAFVYLVEPDHSPSSLPLQRHAAMMDKFVEFWSHVTGARSSITTETRFDSGVGFGRSPQAIRSNIPRHHEPIH